MFATLCLLLAPAAMAAPPSVFDSFDSAARSWLNDSGLLDRGGYGRYPEDRQGAEAVQKAVAALNPQAVPRRVGNTWGWAIRANGGKHPGHCTLATVLLAISFWKDLAERGVRSRPVMVELECPDFLSVATFRHPDHPGPKKGYGEGCDVLLLERFNKGETKPEELYTSRQLFGFPTAKLEKPPEARSTPHGAKLEQELLEEHVWLTVARSAPQLPWGTFPAAKALADPLSGFCEAVPTMSLEADLLCSAKLVPARDAASCLGAGLLLFIRERQELLEASLDFDGLSSAFAFRCASDHRGVFTLNRQQRVLEVLGPEGGQPVAVAIPALAAVALDPSRPWGPRWLDEQRAKHRAPSGKAAGEREGWYQRHMTVAASLVGVDHRPLMDLLDFDLVGFIKRLESKPGAMECEPRAKAAQQPRTCKVASPVMFKPGACEATAWALSGALPHRPKPLFAQDEPVQVLLQCGPPGSAETNRVAVAMRAPQQKNVIGVELSAGFIEGGEPQCVDMGLAADCDEPGPPVLKLLPHLTRLVMPADPAELRP
jgi:hypothetical protein